MTFTPTNTPVVIQRHQRLTVADVFDHRQTHASLTQLIQPLHHCGNHGNVQHDVHTTNVDHGCPLHRYNGLRCGEDMHVDGAIWIHLMYMYLWHKYSELAEQLRAAGLQNTAVCWGKLFLCQFVSRSRDRKFDSRALNFAPAKIRVATRAGYQSEILFRPLL